MSDSIRNSVLYRLDSIEAVVCCKGSSDSVAQEYAWNIARILQNRAKGFAGRIPRIRARLFEPNRNLTLSTLDGMWQKYSSAWESLGKRREALKA